MEGVEREEKILPRFERMNKLLSWAKQKTVAGKAELGTYTERQNGTGMRKNYSTHY